MNYSKVFSFLGLNRNSKTNYYWPLLLAIIRIILLQYHTYCLNHTRAFCRIQILTTNFIVVQVHVLKKVQSFTKMPYYSRRYTYTIR